MNNKRSLYSFLAVSLLFCSLAARAAAEPEPAAQVIQEEPNTVTRESLSSTDFVRRKQEELIGSISNAMALIVFSGMSFFTVFNQDFCQKDLTKSALSLGAALNGFCQALNFGKQAIEDFDSMQKRSKILALVEPELNRLFNSIKEEVENEKDVEKIIKGLIIEDLRLNVTKYLEGRDYYFNKLEACSAGNGKLLCDFESVKLQDLNVRYDSRLYTTFLQAQDGSRQDIGYFESQKRVLVGLNKIYIMDLYRHSHPGLSFFTITKNPVYLTKEEKQRREELFNDRFNDAFRPTTTIKSRMLKLNKAL